MEKRHAHEIEIDNLKQNKLVCEIIKAIKCIDSMNEIEFDTMWEKELMKYRVITKIINDNL